MLQLHLGMTEKAARKRSEALLGMVGVPGAADRLDDYPHQFSGGMCQRVMIAMAISCSPRILFADEPTTALDVTTQAQLLKLMKDTVQELGTSLVLVTHNLGLVARYAQRIYVMYAGRIVESGTTREIFSNPRHPYTVGLLKSIPRLDAVKGKKLIPIEGMPPNLINMPPTCAFLPRCTRRIEECYQKPQPPLFEADGQHFYRCYLREEHH
jgi:peptide/nickel transport system ATP-binding protein